MIKTLISTIFALVIGATPSPTLPRVGEALFSAPPQTEVFSSRAFSLDNRYAVKSVNEVMKKNILLNIAYLGRQVEDKGDINWDLLLQPSHTQFELKPNETFAYHDIVKNEYQSSLALTTETSFNAADGYLSDGYLYGDGVCHLASLMNWVARDAGLEVNVPKDHRSVGPINEVPDEYGVSIYKNAAANIGANNNLYITNNREVPVTFHFEFDGSVLKISVT